jgi:hypothetical protein
MFAISVAVRDMLTAHADVLLSPVTDDYKITWLPPANSRYTDQVGMLHP